MISSTPGGSVVQPGEGSFVRDWSQLVDLVAVSDAGYEFVGWSGSLGTVGDPLAATTNIGMFEDFSVQAVFAPVPVVPIRPYPWLPLLGLGLLAAAGAVLRGSRKARPGMAARSGRRECSMTRTSRITSRVRSMALSSLIAACSLLLTACVSTLERAVRAGDATSLRAAIAEGGDVDARAK